MPYYRKTKRFKGRGTPRGPSTSKIPRRSTSTNKKKISPGRKRDVVKRAISRSGSTRIPTPSRSRTPSRSQTPIKSPKKPHPPSSKRTAAPSRKRPTQFTSRPRSSTPTSSRINRLATPKKKYRPKRRSGTPTPITRPLSRSIYGASTPANVGGPSLNQQNRMSAQRKQRVRMANSPGHSGSSRNIGFSKGIGR